MSHNVPFLDLSVAATEVETEIRSAMKRVTASGRFIGGDEVGAFEHEFAQACGARHCVGAGNGFDALALVLRGWGIGAGDDVLVPGLTAIPTWMAVASVGARPVPVDVDERTLGMDAHCLEQMAGPRTRAVVPVHLYGTPVDMEAVGAVAREHGLRILEDAAQAHGARWKGKSVGTLGDAGAFSFYPTKNLGALGDAGAVVTDDDHLADTTRVLQQYGCRERDRPELLGVNSRLDELQAAVLRVKLGRLAEWNERRQVVARRYLEELSDLPEIRLPSWPREAQPVWNLFVIRSDRREELRLLLERRGIGTLVHYPVAAVDTAPFADWGRRDAAPVSRRAASQLLSLPLHPHLTRADQDAVMTGVRAAISELRRG